MGGDDSVRNSTRNATFMYRRAAELRRLGSELWEALGLAAPAPSNLRSLLQDAIDNVPSGGGPPYPEMPAEIFAAWEPDNIVEAGGNFVSWEDKVGGVVLTPGLQTPTVTTPKAIFTLEDGNPLQKGVTTASLASFRNATLDPFPAAGGMIVVFNRDPAMTGAIINCPVLQLTGTAGGGYQVSRAGDAPVVLSGGTTEENFTQLLHVQLRDAEWLANGFPLQVNGDGNLPFGFNDPSAGNYSTPALTDFGRLDATISGIYFYTGTAGAPEVQQYVCSRFRNLPQP